MDTAKLKIQLQEQNNAMSPTYHNQAYYRPGSASLSPASGGQTPTVGSKPLFHTIRSVSQLAPRQDTPIPELHGVTDRSSSEAMLELMYSGWNPDLPERHILDH